MKRALSTGITGQDSSDLAELLLEKSYEVQGAMRKLMDAECLSHMGCRARIQLEQGSLTSMRGIWPIAQSFRT